MSGGSSPPLLQSVMGVSVSSGAATSAHGAWGDDSAPPFWVKGGSVGSYVPAAGRRPAGEVCVAPSRSGGGALPVPDDVEVTDAWWLPEVCRRGMRVGVEAPEAEAGLKSVSLEYPPVESVLKWL